MTKQPYVLGFMFSPDRRRVVLIQKLKPEWQAGSLNGVGGKRELGETPHAAIAREFFEETGVATDELDDWEHFCKMTFEHAIVDCFHMTSSKWDKVKTMEAEEIGIYEVESLRHTTRWGPPVLPNLAWLIPLALDPSTGFVHYQGIDGRRGSHFDPTS